MRNYFFYVILSGFFLSGKSHVIKAVVLAVLGLAGLWLLHLLAQDYQQIQNPNKKWLFKRSVDNQLIDYTSRWSTIWDHDPIGCVRSLICQLAANESSLDEYSTGILNLARSSLTKKSRTVEELENAIMLGETKKDDNACFKAYEYCPFSARSMLKILSIVRSSTDPF